MTVIGKVRRWVSPTIFFVVPTIGIAIALTSQGRVLGQSPQTSRSPFGPDDFTSLPAKPGVPLAHDLERLNAPARIPFVRTSADSLGQFRIDATANGAPFRFLIDTGASQLIFRKSDAARLGIDPKQLVFDVRMTTANGTTRMASIKIIRFFIGPFKAFDVPAFVNEGEMEEPLLGMSLLKWLRVSIANDTLTLYSKTGPTPPPP